MAADKADPTNLAYKRRLNTNRMPKQNDSSGWRARVTGFAACVLASVSPAWAGLPAHASFYLPGMKNIFVVELDMVKVMKACWARLEGRCGDLPKETLNDAEEEGQQLQNITVFVLDTHAVPSGNRTTLEQYSRAMADLRSRYVREYFDYEIKVFARYAAATDVCPAAKSEQDVATMLSADLTRYWKLPQAQLEEARARFAAHKPQYVDEVRKMPNDVCVKSRKQGELLVSLVSDRIEPYVRGKKPPTLMSEWYRGVTQSAWYMLGTFELEAGNKRFEHFLKEDDTFRNRCRALQLCTEGAQH